MSDPAQLERTLSEALDKFTGSFKELLHELRSAGGGGGAGASGGGDTSTLCSSFESITSTGNQSDTLRALVDSAASFAGRCALLVVKGDKLVNWRAQGFDDEGEAGLKKLNLSADGNSGWKQAVQASGPVAAGLGKAIFQAVGAPGNNQAYLVPLLVKGHAVAMLYADAGADEPVDAGALRLLSSTAGMHLEISAARAKGEEEAGEEEEAAPAEEAAPPPPPPPPPPAPSAPAAKPVKLTAPDLSRVPAADHDIHKKAFRFRSEERRVGKECTSWCRSRWSPYH